MEKEIKELKNRLNMCEADIHVLHKLVIKIMSEHDNLSIDKIENQYKEMFEIIWKEISSGRV